MKRQALKWLFLLGMILFVPSLKGQSYQKLWKEVEKYQRQDQPQKVIQTTEMICSKAEKENNFQQKLKAVMVRTEYRMHISRDSVYKDISCFQRWIANEPDIVHQKILWMMLGNIYDYVKVHASYDKYQTETNIPTDMSEWSRDMFVLKRRDAYSQAVSDIPLLAKTRADSYTMLIEKGDESAFYDHDLLSLMVREIAQKSVEYSDTVFVTRLYDKMIAYYHSVGKSEAMWMSRLAKLDYEYQISYEKRAMLSDTLQSWIAQNKEPMIAPYIYQEAVEKTYSDSLRYVLSTEALSLYPGYKFADFFKNSIYNVTYPFCDVLLKGHPLKNSPLELNVKYRSLNKLTVKVFRKTDHKLIEHSVFQLQAKIPYERTDTLLCLKPFPEVGEYVIEIQAGKEKKTLDVNYTMLFSPMLSSYSDKQIKILVVDNVTGFPVKDATVELMKVDRSGRKGIYTSIQKQQTGADGRALFEHGGDFPVAFFVHKEEYGRTDTVEFYMYGNKREEASKITNVRLYTDRAVYRPGQVIQISGIAFYGENNDFSVIKNREFVLHVKDASNQQLAELKVRTNEMGSFSTRMVLPEKCMSGNVSIQCGNNGSINCLVEEYKRPTFEVCLLPVRNSYMCGDTVIIEGEAKTMTGSPVANATVTYKVSPDSYYFESLSATSGQTVTDSVGRFCLHFVVKQKKSSFMRSYMKGVGIDASVTDLAGETQDISRRIVISSDKSIQFLSDIPDVWVKESKDSIRINVTNMDNQTLNVKGKYMLLPLNSSSDKESVVGDPVYTGIFKSNVAFKPDWIKNIPSGKYRIAYEAADLQNRIQKDYKDIVVFSTNDSRSPVDEVLWTYQKSSEITPENPAECIVGVSGKNICLYYEVYCKDKLLHSEDYVVSDTLLTFRYKDSPEYDGEFSVYFMVVKDGNCYRRNYNIVSKLDKHNLRLKWETFRDHLRPGQDEEWRLKIFMPDGSPANAELMATLYDASLDKYRPHNWSLWLPYYYSLPYSFRQLGHFYFNSVYFNLMEDKKFKLINWEFDHWIKHCGLLFRTFMDFRMNDTAVMTGSLKQFAPQVKSVVLEEPEIKSKQSVAEESLSAQDVAENALESLGPTVLRSDFSETAFFYPHIRTDEQGVATIVFTLPQSVTTWAFKGLAHTADMHYGTIAERIVASKEFMLQQQLPRFVRVDDKAVLSATLDNTRSEKDIKGVVRMELFDPQTEKVYVKKRQKFSIKAGATAVVSFDAEFGKPGLLACRMVAEGDTYSDGEQRYLPVLSNKEWITESKTISLNGKGEYEMKLDGLFNNGSSSATQRRLTVEYVNHPAWLAVMALPSVATPKNEDAISLASAYYATRLAHWIVNSSPRLKKYLDVLRTGGQEDESPESKLEQNEELKNILLEETPWIYDAKNETEQLRLLATLADENQIRSNASYMLSALKALQRADGGWSWFKGMMGSRYVTMTVVETLARLNAMTNGQYKNEIEPLLTSGMQYLGEEVRDDYNGYVVKLEKKDYIPVQALHFLYLHTLYPMELDKNMQTIENHYISLLAKIPAPSVINTILDKAVAAQILHHAGKDEAADIYMKSLLEYSVKTDEMGRYYDASIARYSWADYRIPTQVMVVEACRALGVDKRICNEYLQWILKQKQVQAWSNAFNSVNAIYALMQGGSDSLLENDTCSVLKLDGKQLSAPDDSLTTGYVKEAFPIADKKRLPSVLEVNKPDAGMSWGSVYAQYLENLENVSAHAGELSVERRLYVRRIKDGEEYWQEVDPEVRLQVGDRILSRLVVHADRDMDFVQLEDKRAACMEPGVQLSGYVWQNNTGYYRVIKDNSVRYFADMLRKGVHMFDTEYSITMPGIYRQGIATVQSAYDASLNAHTSASLITVLK